MKRVIACLLALMLAQAVAAQEPAKEQVAVLDFQTTGGLTPGEISTLTNRFRGILVQTNAFAVVEREKMASILQEQDFSLTDACNTAECAVCP